MKILIFSQYFWPEPFIINDLTRTLRDLGHDVVVATGKPNYPDGDVFEGYSADGVQTELFDGNIPVVRVPLRPRGRGGALNLFRNYVSFVLSGWRWFPSLLKGRSFDAILVFAVSPLLMVIPAIRLRRRTSAHLAVWVQDLWPESLAATGYVRNRLALGAVGMVVRAIYARTDTLLVQSQAFVAPVSRYADRDKIVCYANSMRADETPAVPAEAIPSSLMDTLAQYFCVVFAGNVGTAQSPETLVDAARLVGDLPDVRLVVVGSGSMLDWLSRQKVEHGLDNLVLTGRFPMAAIPAIYAQAACLLVTLRDEEIYSFTVPAKVQAYLAAGRPIIASVNGEAARIVTEARAGVTCPADDAPAVARAIRALHGMTSSERADMGASGRRYFLEHFEMRRQAAELVTILEGRIASAGSRG